MVRVIVTAQPSSISTTKPNHAPRQLRSQLGNAEGDSTSDIRSRNRTVVDAQPRIPRESGRKKSRRSQLDDKEVLHALPMAGYRTDAEGWIKFYNSAASELWGYTPAIGSSRWCGSWRLYSSDGQLMPREASPTALSLIEGKAAAGVEAVVERPDGSRVSIVCYPTPLRDASGRIIGAITLLVDVSEQKSIAIEARRLAAIVEGSDDAIISETLDGIVTSWNAGASRIFDYSAQEMVGQSIARIIPFDLQDEERAILAKLTRGDRVDHYETIRLANGARRVPVSVTVSPLRDAAGNVIGASKVARDITARRQSEAALRGANEEAQQARIEAESANRAKTEFLAVMSHEIRTPLNSITGFVDLLTNSTELTPQQSRYAELVKTANAALLTIVNDVLYFSKTEVGELDLECLPFSPTALIQNTVAIVVPSAREKGLRVECTIERGVPKWVMGDQGRLRQVLLNILNNAVKFTNKGSITVNARSRVMPDGRQSIRFSIVDTGIGVPVGQQHRLFKQFSQADSSVSRQYGGTGLGLAICKRLVELMGGEIGIVSDVGQGSNVWFTVCLPRGSGPAPEPDIEASPECGRGAKARILVVDDIDTNLEIVEAYLQDNGYQVDCVNNGPEAIQMLGGAHYDLVLMDVQMPFMDGIAATRRIRALASPIGDIPIVAMTGSVLPQQVRSFLEAGMNDHVGKPIERGKLYNSIRRWLPRSERTKERAGSGPLDFDSLKFGEFVLVVGGEKAARIAERFLASLSGAFKSTPAQAQREAHDLINAAGVLGLDSLVEACRRAADFASSDTSERGRAVMDDLRAAQSAAREAFETQLLPRLRREPIRSSA